MLRNFFVVVFRNARHHKAYAFINISGLAVGIAVCLLIFLVVRYETSFDDFHARAAHIYRVVSFLKTARGTDYESGVPFPTAPALRREYPQLPHVAAIASFGGDGQISILDDAHPGHASQKFREDNGVVYAEPPFFDLFDFKWLAGDKTTALKEPNTVLLTRPMAEKYFGKGSNAIGKTLKLDNALLLKVTGVLADIPANTDFQFKLVISYATLQNTGLKDNLNDWVGIFGQHYCFVELPADWSEAQFNNDLTAVVNKYKPVEDRNEGMMLLPLNDMHFDARFNTFNNHPFSRDLIRTLSLIGLFVLVIACVNFINLATAQAVNRSKEVGMRKVLGSSRWQLLAQFLSEAALLVVVAAAIAGFLVEISLPFFNRLLGIEIAPGFMKDPVVIAMLALTVSGTALLAGFYPAVVLSGFNPIAAFKNKVSAGFGAVSLRRALVVLQFAISQTLIIGVLIIISQVNYFNTAPLGFDKTAIVITHVPDHSKIDVLQDKLAQLQGIEKVSFSFGSPIDNNDWNADISYNNEKKNDFGADLKWADTAYPGLYKLKLLAGRFYSQSDTVKDLVVNETFLRKLGIRDPQTAIGAKVDGFAYGNPHGTITGVVKDFNIASFHDSLGPVILGTWKGTYSTVNIRIEPSKLGRVLPALEKLWKTTFPDDVYEYRFLDENIAKYYDQEAKLSALYKIFAGIAIFISCLGLYGLVSFMAVQRAREVGIRKTLGASAGSIVYLFSREFTILILIAFFIAAPVAGYLMHRWLQNYAFHIQPGPGIFVLAIAASLFIAWLSVGYKAVRAAMANPVKSLKTE